MPGSSEARLIEAERCAPGTKWQWLLFLFINGIILAVLFWPAMVGRAMLAPLDLAPNLFTKYGYVDPQTSGVPANQYVVDLIFSDVSRNLLVHEAWQRGEMPWWDPYTDGGKPLAAEANAVNVSDPFKVVLFHTLPFEQAYNWIRIIPFLVSGMAAFLLLRRFGFSFVVSLWGGLLYEFAGCNFVMFSGPTVQAAFAYYPLLWLLWHRAVQERRFVWFPISTLVTALIFLSGNLQSHSYVFLFAIAFLVGYGWKRPERWRLLLGGTACALSLGLCLSAPFVLPQVELYFLSARKLHPAPNALSYLSGLASISTLFPWSLGTFRTLDLSKVFGQSLLGFWAYIGSAALIIAMIGAWRRAERNTPDDEMKRTALALVVIYLVVCSTPLLPVLYTRTAWLAVLGIIVLFARGWTFLSQTSRPLKLWARIALVIATLAAVGTNVVAGVVYPKFQTRIEARFIEAHRTNPSFGPAEALRRFQVRNFSNEVSFKNPETLLAFSGMVALGLFLLRPAVPRGLALNGILILSTLPLLSFGHRYIPMQPLALWERIRAGGPEQQRVASELRPRHLRLKESAHAHHDMLFPAAMSQIFKVHALHGYCSLTLSNASFLTDSSGRVPSIYYDYEYRSPAQSAKPGEIVRSDHAGLSRFQWSGGSRRQIIVKEESLTQLTLSIERGDAEDLIRTDSFYPGWRAFSGSGELKVAFESPCFSRIHIPAATTEVRFAFQPRPWRLGLWMAAIGTVITGFLMAVSYRHRTIT